MQFWKKGILGLQLQKFREEYYSEYVSWFTDKELNLELGPMDGGEGKKWLQAAMSEPESEGMTWMALLNDEFVAVIETGFDPEERQPAAIAAFAVRPDLRRKGIGSSVLRKVLALHVSKGIIQHTANIHLDNIAGRKCAEKVGFLDSGSGPNEPGYVEFFRG